MIVREVLPNAENEKKHKVKARFSVHFPRSGSVMLRLKSENLRSKLRRMPLLRALPPLAAGILLADHYVLPLWLLVGGFLVCGILALLADDRGANLATLGAILLFGMTVTELRHTPAPPTGTPGEYEIIVRERLSEREGKTASGTTIRARRNSATGEWLPRRRKPRGAMRLFDRTESRRPSRRTRQKSTLSPPVTAATDG